MLWQTSEQPITAVKDAVVGSIAPESSRRARSLPVWATLRAYGRSGIRAMIERHVELTARMAQRVDEAPELERLAEANPYERQDERVVESLRALGYVE